MAHARLPVELRVDSRWDAIPDRYRADAKALYMDVVLYSGEMLVDGRVSRPVLVTICEANAVKTVRPLVDALVHAGFLSDQGSGRFLIVDWERYHSSRAEVERQRLAATERKRRSRSQLVLGDVTPDVTPGVTAGQTGKSQRDEGVPPARARAGGQPQQQRQEDLLGVDEGANEAHPEPDQPAAADTQVEATRPTRVAEIVQAMPGCDIGSVNRIEPLAVQLPAPVFEEIVEKINQRRNVGNPIGLLKTELERELETRLRDQRIAEAHNISSDLVVTSSPVERMKRDEPERYVTAMAKVLEEDAMQAYLDEYVTDENTRIVLLDRYHDERRVESVSR